MTTTQKPNALRLSHALRGGKLIDDSTEWADTLHATAEELLRQHARIEELEAQLSAIGAGGVEPLRKQAEHKAAPADTTAAWVRPVSELLGHISDVLPDNAFNKIDTAKWNAVSALVGATTQAAAARDVARWMGIGEAIERACMDLPDGTEISVSLEKDAGTVTLIDQDGNEHENFSTDCGFAGVLNEAIDAALAAQAKQGE